MILCEEVHISSGSIDEVTGQEGHAPDPFTGRTGPLIPCLAMQSFIISRTLHQRMPRYSGILLPLACAILLILACLSPGCTSSQGPTQPAGTTPIPSGPADTITIRNFAFSPATLTVKTGATVTWINDDSAPHTVVSDDGAPVPFASARLATGDSFQQTFTRAGTYTYHCSIHPSMKGTIIVEP